MKDPSSENVPSTSSPPSSSNGPLMIEKSNLDLILRLDNLGKVVFNPNAQDAQFYNVVEDLA